MISKEFLATVYRYSTLFSRLNTAVFINFFVIRVQYLFEGIVYMRAALISNPIYFLQTVVWKMYWKTIEVYSLRI